MTKKTIFLTQNQSIFMLDHTYRCEINFHVLESEIPSRSCLILIGGLARTRLIFLSLLCIQSIITIVFNATTPPTIHQQLAEKSSQFSELFNCSLLSQSPFPLTQKHQPNHQPHEFLHALVLQLQVQSSLTSTPKLTLATSRTTAIKFKSKITSNGFLTHNLAFHARHTHDPSSNPQERCFVHSRDTRL